MKINIKYKSQINANLIKAFSLFSNWYETENLSAGELTLKVSCVNDTRDLSLVSFTHGKEKVHYVKQYQTFYESFDDDLSALYPFLEFLLKGILYVINPTLKGKALKKRIRALLLQFQETLFNEFPPISKITAQKNQVPLAGLRVRMDTGIGFEEKQKISQLIKWIHENIEFPIRLNLYIKNAFVSDKLGEFIWPNHEYRSPRIVIYFLSAKGDLEEVFLTILHEIFHYKEWLDGKWILNEEEAEEYAEEKLECFELNEMYKFHGLKYRMNVSSETLHEESLKILKYYKENYYFYNELKVTISQNNQIAGKNNFNTLIPYITPGRVTLLIPPSLQLNKLFYLISEQVTLFFRYMGDEDIEKKSILEEIEIDFKEFLEQGGMSKD